MSAPDFAAVKADYTKNWQRAEILPKRLPSITAGAQRVLAGKPRYLNIQKLTGIPWVLVGCLHLREADCNFHCQLHNGDPLTGRTYHVPAGRPIKGNPPFTWEESALDALTMRGLDKVHDWSVERFGYEAEGYNGWGYFERHRLSPYDWSGDTEDGSHEMATGKYIRDHVFDASVIDGQPGVMTVLKVLMTMDPSIAQLFAPHSPGIIVITPATAAPAAPQGAPAPTMWASIGSAMSGLFHSNSGSKS